MGACEGELGLTELLELRFELCLELGMLVRLGGLGSWCCFNTFPLPRLDRGLALGQPELSFGQLGGTRLQLI